MVRERPMTALIMAKVLLRRKKKRDGPSSAIYIRVGSALRAGIFTARIPYASPAPILPGAQGNAEKPPRGIYSDARGYPWTRI